MKVWITYKYSQFPNILAKPNHVEFVFTNYDVGIRYIMDKLCDSNIVFRRLSEKSLREAAEHELNEYTTIDEY